VLFRSGQSVLRQRRVQRRWRLAQVGLNLAMLAAGLVLGAFWSPVQRGMSGPYARGSGPNAHSVDLTRFHNAGLADDWLQDMQGNNLASLSTNWQAFGETWFQPGGVIQLHGSYTADHHIVFPNAVEAIPVNRKTRRLHFLHGTVWTEARGAHVGSYVVHYQSGRRESIPLLYGFELQNWWGDSRISIDCERATLAWTGTNLATQGTPSKLRLYCTTWNNPHPSDPITRLDFVSTSSSSCPFLLAVTAD
jgi:hypothetical protein